MNNHALLVMVPIILVGLALFAFFRLPRGARLINQLRPKPKLTDAHAWMIGPVTGEGNQSKNMPLHPTAIDGGGFVIDMPAPDCEPMRGRAPHQDMRSIRAGDPDGPSRNYCFR